MQIPYTQQQQIVIRKVAGYAKVKARLNMRNRGYVKFPVEKKDGSKRWIHAPHYIVKSAQQTVLKNTPSPSVIQNDHEVITGFVPGRSILDNARPHVGKHVVLSVDLKNFFPSIAPRQVKEAFGLFGPEEVKLITTSKLRLPQGAPTSPMIANWVCVEGDSLLVEYCNEHKLTYTRYADDLTFSAIRDIPQDVVDNLIRLINVVFGPKVNIAPNKIKFMRKHKQQRVTGIVVNEKLSIPRARRRQMRAFMHDAEVNGVNTALARYSRSVHHIFGDLSFLHLAHEAEAERYIEQFKELL